MMTYTITSKAGADHGTWAGRTPAEALAAMHRAAGYEVSADGDTMVWASDGDRQLCGDLRDWIITPSEA